MSTPGGFIVAQAPASPDLIRLAEELESWTGGNEPESAARNRAAYAAVAQHLRIAVHRPTGTGAGQ